MAILKRSNLNYQVVEIEGNQLVIHEFCIYEVGSVSSRAIKIPAEFPRRFQVRVFDQTLICFTDRVAYAIQNEDNISKLPFSVNQKAFRNIKEVGIISNQIIFYVQGT